MSNVKILYGDSTTLRLEFPWSWDASNLASITLTASDRAGTELGSASAVMVADIALAANATAGDTTISVTPTLEVDLISGQRYQIAEGPDGPSEEFEVLSYDGVSEVALKRELLYDHADEAVVYPYWATYELDASNTTTFELGTELILEWKPTWTNPPTGGEATIRERAEIINFQFSMPGFEERFAAIFPREYDDLIQPVNRLDAFINEAYTQLGIELKLRGLLIDRVVDNDILTPLVMQKIRWLSLVNADVSYSDEREVCIAEYTRQFDFLCNSPIWTDDNQDGEVADEEITDHEQCFERRF